MFLAGDFAPLLPENRLRELQAAQNTVVGLRPDFTVGYRNDAWDAFAAENDAPELSAWNGRPITSVFHESLQDWYTGLFRRVQDTAEPADHDYECSSPTRYRVFRLRIMPLHGRALLLLHHLTVDRAHDREPHGPDASRYRSADGFVVQCCHCRRTRRAAEPGTWDWVPAYLNRSLPDVSHGLCPPCFRHYFPEAAAARDRSTA